MIKNIMLALLCWLSLGFAHADARQTAKRGLECVDRDRYQCAYDNLTKAADSGGFNANVSQKLREYLRAYMVGKLDNKKDGWSWAKYIRECKKAIALGAQTNQEADWGDIALHYWIGIAEHERGNRAAAKAWGRKADEIRRLNRYHNK